VQEIGRHPPSLSLQVGQPPPGIIGQNNSEAISGLEEKLCGVSGRSFGLVVVEGGALEEYLVALEVAGRVGLVG
jgi:hypothetical protein